MLGKKCKFFFIRYGNWARWNSEPNRVRQSKQIKQKIFSWSNFPTNFFALGQKDSFPANQFLALLLGILLALLEALQFILAGFHSLVDFFGQGKPQVYEKFEGVKYK